MNLIVLLTTEAGFCHAIAVYHSVKLIINLYHSYVVAQNKVRREREREKEVNCYLVCQKVLKF